MAVEGVAEPGERGREPDPVERSLVHGGAGLLDLGTTYTLNLRTNLGNNWTATSTPTVKVRVVSVLGLASASCVP